MRRLIRLTTIVILTVLSVQLPPPSVSYAQSSVNSQLVNWSCTGSPCPWGTTLSGQALVWPAEWGPVNNRLGYTTSAGIYLPASAASGMTIAITSGSATVYAGLPDASSHRTVVSLSSGQSYQVSDLATDEVVSVQGGSFAYILTTPPGFATPTATPTAVNPTATPLPATPTPTATATPITTPSQLVSWSCTGSPCPWGATLSGQALVWPAEWGPVNNRLGYTTSAGIYLPASTATGLTIAITSGSATVYAGLPDASSHRTVVSLSSGQSYQVSDLTTDEVVSVQGGSFAYVLTTPPGFATPTATPTAVNPTATPLPATPTPTATATPITTPSQLVSWSCTGSPCPWGATLSGQALVWSAEWGPVNNRLGYTTSDGIYLPASAASGMTISIVSGSVSIYAGAPDAGSHRTLATLVSGQSYLVTGLVASEVVSVQSDNSFSFTWTAPLPDAPTPIPATPTPTAAATTANPTATSVACPDPTTCNPVLSIPAFWRCDIPGCTDSDWLGTVIVWPAWSAYENNMRAGSNSRTVYSAAGDILYPYMGSWANGCQVTAVSGTVLIVEWQRGTEIWRETYLSPGQTHTITLVSPEDNALIEENHPSPGFSVSLANCNPQVVPKTPTPTPTRPTPTMGETRILPTDDSGNGNILIAQRATLAQNATIESLSFYVTSTAGQLRLGVYTDNNGAPGTLVAETAAFTPVVGWNTQAVLVPMSLPAGTYWLAYLAQSDDLHFRVGGSGPARYYNYPFGAMPTTFSDTTEAINVQWSFYASLLTTPDASTPIPATSTPTVTNTPTWTPTNTLAPTNTPTWTPTNTLAPTNTPTWTPTNTLAPTNTPTWTPTNTPTRTPTNTPTWTPTNTPTRTPTPTNTPMLSNTGLRSPSANAAQTSNAGDNNGFESAAASAYADGGGAAQDVNSGTDTSSSCTATSKDKHLYYNYGINLPGGAIVRGIEVRLDAFVDAVSSNAPAICVQLSWDGGATWTTAMQTPTLTTSEATYILGGATDTWGRSWTTANFSNGNFRLRVIQVASGANANSRDFSLDWVAVRVSYQ